MTVTSPGLAAVRGATTLLCLGVALMSATPVAAHSELVSSTPAAGATLTAPPTSIMLSFSEPLKTGSKADVVDAAGATVGTATIDAADATKLSWTPATPLAAGLFTIRWTSIATDGDVLRGEVRFAVAAAATPAASASASPSPSPSPSPSSAPTPATTDGSVILPVLAALVVIALLALILLRGRRQASR